MDLSEIECHCNACRVLFFPQREALRLDGRKYDCQLLELIVQGGGSCKSFLIASKLLKSFLQLGISAKQVSLLSTLVGTKLQQARDARTNAWKDRPLRQPKSEVQPAIQLASVQIDGGRIQMRDVAAGHGVFNPHWRETKNASFHRMATESFDEDPHPELPACFSSRKNMGELLAGLGDDADQEAALNSIGKSKPDFSWRPEPLFRSCLSSMVSSDDFGPMMAADVDSLPRSGGLIWATDWRTTGRFIAIIFRPSYRS